MMPSLDIVALENLLFPGGDVSIRNARIVLETLARIFGHDTVLGLLGELGDLESECSRPDDDTG